MAKEFILDGTIGGIFGNVTATAVKEMLDEADGDDVVFKLSSPGGSLFEGLAISNLVKQYPGKTTGLAIGLVASMMTYVAISMDELIVEDDAVFMIHNPLGVLAGDYRDAKKFGDTLKRSQQMIARRYSEKTGMSISDASTAMDDETYYFGNEIKNIGFADSVTESTRDKDKQSAIGDASIKIQACIEEQKPETIENMYKIAALLPDAGAGQKPGKPNTNQGKPMNEKEFLAFLETNPEAKAFYDSGMEYIKAVDETRPDLSAIGLCDILALAPTAKTEHETALEDSRKEVEAGKLTAENIKNVADIISSTGYGESIKAAGIKVLTGEKDHSGFEDMVALADETAEQIKSLTANGEQPGDTPADSSTAEQAKQTNTKTAAASLSAAINNTENKVQ